VPAILERVTYTEGCFTINELEILYTHKEKLYGNPSDQKNIEFKIFPNM
jgi:hypothetical protein